jgi:hypothetical protein
MDSPCLTTVLLFTGKAEPADVPTNATPAATKVAIKTLRMRFSSFAQPPSWCRRECNRSLSHRRLGKAAIDDSDKPIPFSVSSKAKRGCLRTALRQISWLDFPNRAGPVVTAIVQTAKAPPSEPPGRWPPADAAVHIADAGGRRWQPWIFALSWVWGETVL